MFRNFQLSFFITLKTPSVYTSLRLLINSKLKLRALNFPLYMYYCIIHKHSTLGRSRSYFFFLVKILPSLTRATFLILAYYQGYKTCNL